MLHNCLTRNKRYDFVITPNRQTKGYIRSKRQTRKKTIITEQKQIIRKRFSKERNSLRIRHKHNTGTPNIKDSIYKNNLIDDQIYYSDSESTTPSSKKGKRKIKKSSINKPKRLYN